MNVKALTARCSHGKLIQEYCAECGKTVKEAPRESQQEPACGNYYCTDCPDGGVSASSSPSPSATPQWSDTLSVERGLIEALRRFMNHRFNGDRFLKEQLHYIRQFDQILKQKASAPQTDRARAEQIVAGRASVFTVTQHQQLVDAIVQMVAEVREQRSEEK